MNAAQLERLSVQAGAAYVVFVACQKPATGCAAGTSTELMHYAAGTPALLRMLEQANHTMTTASMGAVCQDIDEGSAVAE